MSMKKLSDQFYVGPQIEIDDIEDIQISGIKSVICLRPDGEGADQPAFDNLKTQAATLKLAAHYLPIIPGQISEEQIAEFADMVRKSTGPIFAYCLSGMRATALWALHQAQIGQSVDEILAAAKSAGHDLTALAPRLSAAAL
ncbi:protein tyrosine phosphatase family protein [Planktomarina sp.]|uniref:protein tyrosine phosphatase family protein n=1 Tax=uncultured Planktomarina sp. TaxID=1538529 RepID=UPI0023700155|nr:protein tyrosine phosphatase family protein [Planktomarina sp.]